MSTSVHAPTPASKVSPEVHSPESAVPCDSANCVSGVPTVAVVDDGSFGAWRDEEDGWADLFIY
jgi:hypothetical protein